jgi:hypothetical protein
VQFSNEAVAPGFEVGLQAAKAKVRTTGTKVKRMLAMGFSWVDVRSG